MYEEQSRAAQRDPEEAKRKALEKRPRKATGLNIIREKEKVFLCSSLAQKPTDIRVLISLNLHRAY